VGTRKRRINEEQFSLLPSSGSTHHHGEEKKGLKKKRAPRKQFLSHALNHLLQKKDGDCHMKRNTEGKET